MTNIAIRHGVDPRDFSLVAYGAAGPMLLPATLDLLQVRRIIVPPAPGPVLGARPAERRPRLLRQPQRLRGARPRDRAAGRRPCSRRWRTRLRERVGAGRRRRRDPPQLRRPALRPELGDAVHRGAGRPDRRGHDRRADRALPRRVRAALRQPLPDAAGAGRHLPRAARRAGRQGRVRADSTATAGRRPRRRACSSSATSPTSRSTAAEYERETLPPGSRVDGPAIIREPLSTTFVCPGQVADGRPVRRDRDRAGRTPADGPATTATARALIRDLDDEEFQARYRCDRFTATVLASRFGYIVEHMCSQLLTTAFSPILRDFYDFAATVSGPPHADYPTPGGEQQHHPLHRHDGRLGAQHDRGVRPRAARAGRRDRRQRPLPDRHARQRHPLLAAGLPRRARSSASSTSRRTSSTWAAPCPGGFSATKTNVYENGLVLSPRALYRAGQPGAGDVEPDLRQRPLRLAHVPGHADDLREPRARRAPARSRPSSATAPRPCSARSSTSATRRPSG